MAQGVHREIDIAACLCILRGPNSVDMKFYSQIVMLQAWCLVFVVVGSQLNERWD